MFIFAKRGRKSKFALGDTNACCFSRSSKQRAFYPTGILSCNCSCSSQTAQANRAKCKFFMFIFAITCTDCKVQKQVQHDMKSITKVTIERSEQKGLSLFTFHFVKLQQFTIKANMLRNVKMSF